MHGTRPRSGSRSRATFVALLLLACLPFRAVAGTTEPARRDAAAPPPDGGARVRVLGTVQDGGLPHPACRCKRCEAARRDSARRRSVASLALILPENRGAYLVDATPDLRVQLDALPGRKPADGARIDRAPVEGVLLTHAHMGHYTGLIFFGFEALNTKGLPVFCTPEMAGFLRSNGPWSGLVRLGNIALREVAPGTPFALPGGVSATPFLVPHRHEYTDTAGYLFRGPRGSLLYVPDTDGWTAWTTPVTALLEGVDVALLDGTFYAKDELPGRDVRAIGHPLIAETMDLLAPLVRKGRTRVLFTHLNHSNPALDETGRARAEIERRGFGIAREGDEFPL